MKNSLWNICSKNVDLQQFIINIAAKTLQSIWNKSPLLNRFDLKPFLQPNKETRSIIFNQFFKKIHQFKHIKLFHTIMMNENYSSNDFENEISIIKKNMTIIQERMKQSKNAHQQKINCHHIYR